MYVWLMTLRAAEGKSPQVRSLVEEEMLPLLRAQSDCTRPALAACVNCEGEHTYLAYWTSRYAVEAFEAGASYQELTGNLSSLLRVPPKRELWEILAS